MAEPRFAFVPYCACDIADIQHSGRTLVTEALKLEVLTGELQSELLSEWRKGHRNRSYITLGNWCCGY